MITGSLAILGQSTGTDKMTHFIRVARLFALLLNIVHLKVRLQKKSAT